MNPVDTKPVKKQGIVARIGVVLTAIILIVTYVITKVIHGAASWLYRLIAKAVRKDTSFAWAMRAETLPSLFFRFFLIVPNILIVIVSWTALNPIANVCAAFEVMAERGMIIIVSRIDESIGKDEEAEHGDGK